MNKNPNHILFFSKHCDHSKDFYGKLMNTEFDNKFVKICVDNKNYKIPSFINKVPTIIVPDSNTPLTGQNVFEWLDMVIKRKESNSLQNNQQNNGEVNPFSGEMCGLSDQYSLLDNANNSQFERVFSFINNNNEHINTPVAEGSSSDKIKDSTDTAYDRLVASRNMDMPQNNPRI